MMISQYSFKQQQKKQNEINKKRVILKNLFTSLLFIVLSII